MAIPDLLTDEQRIAYGFTLEDDHTARHVRYGVWRYRCSECDLWVRKIERIDDRAVCLKCLAHHADWRKEHSNSHQAQT